MIVLSNLPDASGHGLIRASIVYHRITTPAIAMRTVTEMVLISFACPRSAALKAKNPTPQKKQPGPKTPNPKVDPKP